MTINAANSILNDWGRKSNIFKKDIKDDKNSLASTINKVIEVKTEQNKNLENDILDQKRLHKYASMRYESMNKTKNKTEDLKSDSTTKATNDTTDLSEIPEDLRGAFEVLAATYHLFNVHFGEETTAWEENNEYHFSISEEHLRLYTEVLNSMTAEKNFYGGISSMSVTSHASKELIEAKNNSNMSNFFRHLSIVDFQMRDDPESINNPKYNHWKEINKVEAKGVRGCIESGLWDVTEQDDGSIMWESSWAKHFNAKNMKKLENEINKNSSRDIDSSNISEKDQIASNLFFIYVNNLKKNSFEILNQKETINVNV